MTDNPHKNPKAPKSAVATIGMGLLFGLFASAVIYAIGNMGAQKPESAPAATPQPPPAATPQPPPAATPQTPPAASEPAPTHPSSEPDE